jgi:hypothetical protein
MATHDSHQVAELLVGIARAQQAIIEAIESSKAGFRSTHLMPALTNAARVRDTRRALQLADLPARVLLQCLGRMGPDVEQVARDIEALLTPGRPEA